MDSRPNQNRRIALPVAGDDEATKAIVLKLVDELRFVSTGNSKGLFRRRRQAALTLKGLD